MKRTYRIDQNVPIPKSKHAKYPWDRMDVGDSFYIPNMVNPNPYSCVTNANKRYKAKFLCRRDAVEPGFRIWRIE